MPNRIPLCTSRCFTLGLVILALALTAAPPALAKGAVGGEDGALTTGLSDGFCMLTQRQRTPPPSTPLALLLTVGETEPNNTQATANFVALGFDAGEDVAVDFTGSIAAGDTDFVSFDLEPGDILGANYIGSGATTISLRDPGGALQVGSSTNITFIYPNASPLPGSGAAASAWVTNTAGTYAMQVSGGSGAYTLELRVFRAGLEGQGTGNRQIVFLDFDGELLNVQAIFGQGNANANLSPLSAFLPAWGLTAADENAVIDAILAAFEEAIESDIEAMGLNGDFETSNVPGEFDIEIRNSRDHADPFGQANVSRIIVGGTIAESGIGTIGIAESIDPGNYATGETALMLLDTLSAPAGGFSLNTVTLAAGTTIIDLIGVAVGNISAHEAGHYLGNFHTHPFNAQENIMDAGPGGLGNLIGIGPDNVFGSADDVDVNFGDDTYYPAEGFTGTEDTLNVVSFDCPTGTVPTCVTAKTQGRWNLPGGGLTGAVFGTLFDPASAPLYTFSGTLTATSATGGTITGTLFDATAPNPDFNVTGTYTILTFGTVNTGRWSARIFDVTSGLQVGKMGGAWKDNPAVNITGKYEGDWKICQ